MRTEHEGGRSKKIALIGAAGAVGSYIVHLAALAGLHVVAVSSSQGRDKEFLISLGATELLEYKDLQHVADQYDLIIDAVGGEALEHCWSAIKADGVLISVEPASSDFVSRHRQGLLTIGKHGVRALFFIVEPSRKQSEELSVALDLGLLQVVVGQEGPLLEGRAAYELANGPLQRRGKVVLTI